MNKVDLLVRSLLLEYPTLYQTRFDVLSEIFFNSCYGWDKNGCIVPTVGPPINPTPESMVAQYEEKLAEYEEKAKEHDCLIKLHTEWVVEAKQQLLVAKFRAENIDVIASGMVNVDYSDVWAWLWDTHRHGLSKYGCIQNAPENVDEDWRAAICEWTGEMIPSMNSLWGWMPDKGPWEAQEAYKEIFDWVYMIHHKFRDNAAYEAQTKLANEIMDRILAKREE